jgi:small subunit ribosomal protein S13
MRISGITIPANKKVIIGLTSVYGVGISTAKKILKDVGVDEANRISDVSLDQEAQIRKIIEAMNIEGNLKREVASNIKRLKDIKCYKGIRHMRRLPVNGQRTKTNSRTIRGNVRATMGSGRRKESKT